MKIIAFGASTSQNSINQKFAQYAAKLLDANAEVISLLDYPVPLFSVDEEKASGIPANAVAFYEKLLSADFLVISMAEHNGSYTAAFKNLFDWVSRHYLKMFENKKMLLLSTSPGGRGGQSVMETALERFPIHGAEMVGHFSLPKFHDNFEAGTGIKDKELADKFASLIEEVKTKLN